MSLAWACDRLADVDVRGAGIAARRTAGAWPARRSRGCRTRWRPPSRRPPSAACRAAARSGSRVSRVGPSGLWSGGPIDADPAAGAASSWRWRRRRASPRGRRRTSRRRAVRSCRRRRRRRRRRGNERRGCRRSPRRGHRAASAAARPCALISAGLRSRISLGWSRWPSHSWSGFSWSHAAAPTEPSTSYWSEVLAAGAQLRDGEDRARAVLVAHQHGGHVLGADLARDGVGGAFGGERLDRPASAAGGRG